MKYEMNENHSRITRLCISLHSLENLLLQMAGGQAKRKLQT